MKPYKISLSNTEKLSLISNLSTMLSAGIAILPSIEALLEDSKGGSKKILEEARADLLQGKHLNTSFAKFPNVFDKVTVNIIRGAEEAGQLATTLKDLRGEIRKQMEFNDKIRSALTYPVLVLLVMVGILTLILVVAVPKIASVFSRLRVDVPLPTKVMFYISHILLTYTIPVILGIILLCIGVYLLYQKKRRWLLSLFYPLPLLSTLFREIDLTRFSRSMYLLLSSGITITNALELTEDVVQKPEIARSIAFAKETISSGENLSVAFKKYKKIFPGVMVKIIEAGEKTGTLDKSMQDISEYLDYRVTNSLKTLTVVLEPIMLVVVGLLVGGMMLSIIAPIYNLIGQVSPR
ncbi:type II secretion system F family protein [Candidatus Microgenomates bacterium]|nr:type II secretion system F family protein [Candidatus Microgenomates bacterium]